jgi:hypothetical protein
MLKLTVAVLAVALAGSASAAGYKSLRVDASNEAAFEQSLATFKEKLSPARRFVFGEALKDIWVEGAKAAEAEQREYTADDYYRQLHGLGYEEVVTFTDPTGKTAKDRYRSASYARYTPAVARPNPKQGSRPVYGWGLTGDRLARSD